MLILNISNNYRQIINTAAKNIKEGNLVVFPSDTVYILAVDASNQKATDLLLSFKNRWTGKAISIAVSDIEMAKKYVKLSANAKKLYQNLFPGPFTIISPGRHCVAKGIEAENGTLGIRIPESKYISDLIKATRKPITATSANLAGRASNYSIDSFLKPLSQKKKNLISLIINAGKLPKNKPSTVIDAVESEIKILRPGDLITGSFETFISKSEIETGKIAEFLLKKAFQLNQNKPVIFLLSGDLGSGKTVFSRNIGKKLGVNQKILSPTFVIYNQYPLNNSVFKIFYHFDLFRLTNYYEYQEINFLNYFLPQTISCLEWPENMGKKLFKKISENSHIISVNFSYLDLHTRQILFSFPNNL